MESSQRNSFGGVLASRKILPKESALTLIFGRLCNIGRSSGFNPCTFSFFHSLGTQTSMNIMIKNEMSHAGIWCNSHGMKLNISKTKQTLCKRQHNPNDFNYTDPKCTRLKILGIIYDENLNWSTHIESTIRKAN